MRVRVRAHRAHTHTRERACPGGGVLAPSIGKRIRFLFTFSNPSPSPRVASPAVQQKANWKVLEAVRWPACP